LESHHLIDAARKLFREHGFVVEHFSEDHFGFFVALDAVAVEDEVEND
jgi:hypothetical protein